MGTFKNALIFLLNKIINELYPNQCIICGKLYSDEICIKCYKTLEILAKTQKYNNKSFKEHIYLFKYEGRIRKLIIDYKFNDKAYLSNFFTKIIIKNEKICRKIKSYDIIIPVPIHKKRKNERGYNQSELIAKKIAKNINELELVTDYLIKQKNTVAQSTLTKQQRKQNVKQVYKIGNKEKIQNKKIILLDDIYTTGATAEECSKILKQNGAKEILVLTIAKDEIN